MAPSDFAPEPKLMIFVILFVSLAYFVASTLSYISISKIPRVLFGKTIEVVAVSEPVSGSVEVEIFPVLHDRGNSMVAVLESSKTKDVVDEDSGAIVFREGVKCDE